MFNTDYLDTARQNFKQYRFAVLDNILQENYITELYKSVTQIPYGYWGCVQHKHTKISPEKMQSLDETALREEYKQESQTKFGYWHRAKWILNDSDCVFPLEYPLSTEFTRVVNEDYSLVKPDPTFVELAEYVTGFTNMATKNPTYSYYDHHSWLNPHHDPARWCAYIFYFNPNWQAHWGGQLCIMNDDEKTIRTSIEPFGNRLLLMDVSETVSKRINKHFISPVSYISPYPRYSLAGWFTQKDSQGPSPNRFEG